MSALLYADQVQRAAITIAHDSGAGSINVTGADNLKTARLDQGATVTWSSYSGTSQFKITATLEQEQTIYGVALVGLGLLTTALVSWPGGSAQNLPGVRSGFTRILQLDYYGNGDVATVEITIRPGTASGTMTLGRLFAGSRLRFVLGGGFAHDEGAQSLDDVTEALSGETFGRPIGRLRSRSFQLLDTPAASPPGSSWDGMFVSAVNAGEGGNVRFGVEPALEMIGLTTDVVAILSEAAPIDDRTLYGYLTAIDAVQHVGADCYRAGFTVLETG